MNIAEHHRNNHEATDSALNDVEMLVEALALLSVDLGSSSESMAMMGIIGAVQRRIKDVDRLRAVEWVGLGGEDDDRLSAQEIARARGEKAA